MQVTTGYLLPNNTAINKHDRHVMYHTAHQAYNTSLPIRYTKYLDALPFLVTMLIHPVLLSKFYIILPGI